MLEAARAIVAEFVREVAHGPVRFAAEVIQFGLLVALVRLVTIGVGRRRGFAAKMLAERRESLAERLARAEHADEVLAAARAEARRLERAADAEARKLLAEAKTTAALIEAEARRETGAEIERIERRVQEAVSSEAAQMHEELREQLVAVVTQATRSIMNEQLTVQEQRDLIERALLGAVGESS